MNPYWQTIVVVLIGTFIMRLGGRKSLSQMTIAQTIVIISIGKVLIEPVTQKQVGPNFLIAITMVIVLWSLEILMLKSRFFEDLIGGKPVIVIEKGVTNQQNMKKLRMTIGELEARLRQHGIDSISQIDYATIDPNGEIGYRWMPEYSPATLNDLDALHKKLNKIEEMLEGK